jgi:hypothetical protein
MPRYDYVSMGFYTFDCLGWPFTEVPPGGGTVFIDELTIAVWRLRQDGAQHAGTTGLGEDLMGDW